MINYNIKNKIKELFNSNSFNFIGYGYKTISGQKTLTKSIIFGVDTKKSLSELSPEEVIPSNIIVDNQYIPTDVVQLKDIKYISTCYTCSQDSTSSEHRTKHIPLKNGISIGKFSEVAPSTYNSGTIGCVVIDNDTNKLVGLTTSHLLANNYTIASSRIGESTTYNIQNEEIAQPSVLHGGLTSSNIIGKVKRYYPVSTVDETDNIDAGLFTIDSSDPSAVSLSESFKQLGLENTSFLPFATTSEIDSLSDNNQLSLVKSGAISGYISCDMSIFGLGTVQIEDLVYPDCIVFQYNESPGLNVVCEGDSGSVLIANFGGILKIVGLIFAGSDSEGAVEPPYTFGFACRIDRIASLLNVSAWNGSSVDPTNTSAWSYVTVSGLSDQININIDDKKYWQIGTVDNGGQVSTLYVTYNNDLVTTTTTVAPGTTTTVAPGTTTTAAPPIPTTTTAPPSDNDCPCDVPDIIDIDCLGKVPPNTVTVKIYFSNFVSGGTIQAEFLDKNGKIITPYHDIETFTSNPQTITLVLTPSVDNINFRLKVQCPDCPDCEDCASECDKYAYGDDKNWDPSGCLMIPKCVVSNTDRNVFIVDDDKLPNPAPKFDQDLSLSRLLKLSTKSSCSGPNSFPSELEFEYDESSDPYDPVWVLKTDINNNYDCNKLIQKIYCDQFVTVNGPCSPSMSMSCDDCAVVQSSKLEQLSCEDKLDIESDSIKTLNCGSCLEATGQIGCLYITIGQNEYGITSYILNGNLNIKDINDNIIFTFPGNNAGKIAIPVRVRWRELYEDYTAITSFATPIEYSVYEDNKYLVKKTCNYKFYKGICIECDKLPDIDYGHSSLLDPRCEYPEGYDIENIDCYGDNSNSTDNPWRKYQENLVMSVSFNNTCRLPDDRECLVGPCRNEIILDSLDKTPGPCDKCYCDGGGRPIDIDYHCVSKTVKPNKDAFPASTKTYTLWFVPRGLSAVPVIDNIIYDTTKLDSALDIVKVHVTNTPEEMREWVCKYLRFVSIKDYSKLKTDTENAVESNWPFNDLYWETTCDGYIYIDDIPINLVPC
jgi:hypothetical protein